MYSILYINGYGIELIHSQYSYLKCEFLRKKLIWKYSFQNKINNNNINTEIMQIKKEIKLYEKISIKFLNQSLKNSMTTIDDDQTLILHVLNANLLKAKIYFSIESHQLGSTFDDTFEALEVTEKLSEKFKLHLYMIATGHELLDMQIDEIDGMKLQLHGISKIRESLSQSLLVKYFPLFVVIFPSLKQCEKMILKYKNI